VNVDIFRLWVNGLDEHAVLTECLRREHVPGWDFARLEAACRCEIQDQYRLFSNMEHFFEEPTLLASQPLFQLDPAIEAVLIETYYEFDDAVIRELLGKKLTARLRKDLDVVSEKTRINLRSCQRQVCSFSNYSKLALSLQFDNFARVCRIVEDLTTPPTGASLERTWPCPIAPAIAARLRISTSLSRLLPFILTPCDIHRFCHQKVLTRRLAVRPPLRPVQTPLPCHGHVLCVQ